MVESRQDKPVIGLVGGVGAGKSTAATCLAELGCELIDADAIGHEVLATVEVRQELRQRWGRRIFRDDGSVDRDALGKIVFGDSAELEALNDIMHGRIIRRISQLIERAQGDPAIAAVALDAPVMFEAGCDQMCSHVLFVSAPVELRAARAAERGWDEDSWRLREKSQISLDRKEASCYCKVDNSSSVSKLREQIRRIFQSIVGQAGRT